MVDVYRHGDLLIVPVEEVRDAKTKLSETNCILEGEVTNHHHRADQNAQVNIAVLEPTSETGYYRGYLDIPTKKKTVITHEEHAPIELKEWKYETRVQREYDPIAERRVID